MDDFVAETIRMPGTVESAVATARVALLTRPGGPLELRDVPLPPLGEREVLVRVDACAVCGSDLHTAHGRRPHPLRAARKAKGYHRPQAVGCRHYHNPNILKQKC